MREVFSSLRARVLLLLAIPFMVMFGMSTYQVFAEREERLADAGERVVSTTNLMVAEQRRIIERAHQPTSHFGLPASVLRLNRPA